MSVSFSKNDTLPGAFAIGRRNRALKRFKPTECVSWKVLNIAEPFGCAFPVAASSGANVCAIR